LEFEYDNESGDAFPLPIRRHLRLTICQLEIQFCYNTGNNMSETEYIIYLDDGMQDR